ncbi:MAG: protein-disulfide reductase DsbD family protein [Thermoanaerobaculum sp.]|nr:protein-disulfide reductase DsbD family protein [Thermoanaerobaculum sp.]
MRFFIALWVLWSTSALAQETVFSVETCGWETLPQAGGSPGVVALRVRVQEGWHVNAARPTDPYLIPSQVRLQLPAGWQAGEAEFPPPKRIKLEVFQDVAEVLEGSFWVRIPIRLPAGATGQDLAGELEAQACNNVSCLPPKKVTFTVPWAFSVSPLQPASTAAPSTAAPPVGTGLDQRFAGASLLLQLLLAFLGGLALNLTPCVYPIIPVTIGFFLNQAGGTKRTAVLAFLYVGGMAVTYSTLGVVAALTGKLFGAALQSPWVTGAIVIVVLALAASMFGLWELRVPQWASRFSTARQGLLGSLMMGLVVGLVAAPCIGPFVLGLLAYVGQKQDVMLGFVLFFALALGLGLPYLFLALSTRSLEKLPHSGAWMEGVRQLFGVLLVALALYFARPLLPAGVGDRLLALSLIAGGFYLAVIARPGREISVVDRFMRAVTAALVLVGAFFWPRPQPGGGAHLVWEKANARVLEQAIGQGGPVIVDFYADWCLPCKELDEKTFAHPQVQAKLAQFRRLKVDLTVATPEVEQLRQAFGVAGVPTVLFFNQGREAVELRLTGFEEPRPFLERLDEVLGAKNKNSG